MAKSSPTMNAAQRAGLRNLGARNVKAQQLKTGRMNANNSSLYKTLQMGPAPKGSMLTTSLKKKGMQKNYSK